MRTNSDLVLATWQDQVGAQNFTLDGDSNERRVARIAKKEYDKEKRHVGKVHKKCLYILFDPNSKAFQGWKVVVESWSYNM